MIMIDIKTKQTFRPKKKWWSKTGENETNVRQLNKYGWVERCRSQHDTHIYMIKDMDNDIDMMKDIDIMIDIDIDMMTDNQIGSITD